MSFLLVMILKTNGVMLYQGSYDSLEACKAQAVAAASEPSKASFVCIPASKD